MLQHEAQVGRVDAFAEQTGDDPPFEFGLDQRRTGHRAWTNTRRIRWCNHAGPEHEGQHSTFANDTNATMLHTRQVTVGIPGGVGMVRAPMLRPTFLGLFLVVHPLLAQASAPEATPRPALPMTVEQAMQLQHVRSVHLGANCVVWSTVVPRPIADGPGGPWLHVFVCPDLAAALRAEVRVQPLLVGKETPGNLAIRPGSRHVTFTRPIDGRAQMLAIAIDGQGEPSRVATTPAIALAKWRADGKAFAFTSLDPVASTRAAAQKAGFQQIVVDEDWRHLSLWVWEEDPALPEGRLRKVTEGRTVFDFEWAPDGNRIAIASAPRNLVDDSYMFQRLWLVDLTAGTTAPLADNPGKLGAFTWSPDGRRVAFISAEDRNDPHAGMLWIAEASTGRAHSATPMLLGMVQDLEWTDDLTITALVSHGTRTAIESLSPQRNDEPAANLFGDGRLAITSFTQNAEVIVAVGSRPDHGNEVFVANRKAPRHPIRLTDSNPWLAEVALGEQSVEVIGARDGLPIEGVLIKPLGWRAGRRHPFVIVVHGGPEAHFSNGWLTSYSNWGQLLAARGYVSWYPNYRASTGQGVEFCKLDHGDPMGREFEDHLDAIEHFAAQGLIDRDRVGIGGGSYGGYAAAWAATRHSRHFAAAVSFVPFVHIPTKWLTSDIPWEFYLVHYQEKWPWEQPGFLADRSPLTWAQDCRTPLLLLGGTADPRVHPSQPFMLYRAVKSATTTPVRYVQYPGEGHGNRTNVYQYDYALRTLQWFDSYLQGDGDRRSRPLPAMDVGYPLK